MKTIQMLTAVTGILLAVSGPSLAAQRAHRGVDAYASGAVTTDRSGAYYYGPQGADGRPIVTPTQTAPVQTYRGQSEPFSDRPYGAPDNW